jgi:hypothetical protein
VILNNHIFQKYTLTIIKNTIYCLLILGLFVINTYSFDFVKHTKNPCFPNSRALSGSMVIGLAANMYIVLSTVHYCYSQTECLKYLFIANDVQGVAWVTFRVSA